MTSREFCYWLQGYFDIAHTGAAPPEPISRYNLQDHHVELIRKHLSLVFKHEIDPSYGAQPIQDALNALHNPPKPQNQTGAFTPSNGMAGNNPNLLVRC